MDTTETVSSVLGRNPVSENCAHENLEQANTHMRHSCESGRTVFCTSRKQQARAYSSDEAEFDAAASATSETMLNREVSLLMGPEVRTEFLLDSARARGICRREGVGTIRHCVNESSLATAVGETAEWS